LSRTHHLEFPTLLAAVALCLPQFALGAAPPPAPTHAKEPPIAGTATVEVNDSAPRSIVTALHHRDRDMGPDLPLELDPLPPPTLIRCYITRFNHQVSDMGPNPYTEIEPLPPIIWVDGFPVRPPKPKPAEVIRLAEISKTK